MDTMSEVEKTTQEPAPYSPLSAESWDELMSESATIPGYDLLTDADTDALVGIPMIVTKASFRKGVSRKGRPNFSEENPNDGYVSLEILLAPVFDMAQINRARKANDMTEITSLSQLPFRQSDHVVINDGSTGIYRQVVAFLATADYIDLNEGEVVGGKGETILDTVPNEWAAIRAGNSVFDDDGFLTAEFNVRLACRRGLRLSRYDTEYNPDGATTRYLA
jgi:hypothetical protein